MITTQSQQIWLVLQELQPPNFEVGHCEVADDLILMEIENENGDVVFVILPPFPGGRVDVQVGVLGIGEEFESGDAHSTIQGSH